MADELGKLAIQVTRHEGTKVVAIDHVLDVQPSCFVLRVDRCRSICCHACSVFCSSIAIVIGPTPPGTGVIADGLLRHRLVGHVADQAVALGLRGVLHPVDADVDHDRARAAPCRPVTNSALPIAAIRMSADAGDGGQVAGPRVADRHRRVAAGPLLDQQVRHRLADDVASAPR